MRGGGAWQWWRRRGVEWPRRGKQRHRALWLQQQHCSAHVSPPTCLGMKAYRLDRSNQTFGLTSRPNCPTHMLCSSLFAAARHTSRAASSSRCASCTCWLSSCARSSCCWAHPCSKTVQREGCERGRSRGAKPGQRTGMQRAFCGHTRLLAAACALPPPAPGPFPWQRAAPRPTLAALCFRATSPVSNRQVWWPPKPSPPYLPQAWDSCCCCFRKARHPAAMRQPAAPKSSAAGSIPRRPAPPRLFRFDGAGSTCDFDDTGSLFVEAAGPGSGAELSGELSDRTMVKSCGASGASICSVCVKYYIGIAKVCFAALPVKQLSESGSRLRGSVLPFAICDLQRVANTCHERGFAGFSAP